MSQELICESCQEPFEIVDEVRVFGDSIYHLQCWNDYCKGFYEYATKEADGQ